MSAFVDFFTNLAHSVYFGTRKPSRSHRAESWMAETLYLCPTTRHPKHPQHGDGSVPPALIDAADAEQARPKRGTDPRWRLQRCLVSSANQHPKEPAGGSLRIVSVSDTHMKHKFLENRVPDGDVLVHCGDMLMSSVRYSDAESLKRIRSFNRWLGTLPHRHKIVICGNHDGFLQRAGVEEAQRLLSNAVYLCDSAVTIAGVKFYGTPVSWGHSQNDAFQQNQDEEHIARIPSDTDILITHGYPFKDKTAFIKRLRDVQPGVHYCGKKQENKQAHLFSPWSVCVYVCVCCLLYTSPSPRDRG